MSDTPQLLLAHHLKALKLPTFLREYDKAGPPMRCRGRRSCALPCSPDGDVRRKRVGLQNLVICGSQAASRRHSARAVERLTLKYSRLQR